MKSPHPLVWTIASVAALMLVASTMNFPSAAALQQSNTDFTREALEIYATDFNEDSPPEDGVVSQAYIKAYEETTYPDPRRGEGVANVDVWFSTFDQDTGESTAAYGHLTTMSSLKLQVLVTKNAKAG